MQNYVVTPNFYIVMNQQRFDSQIYGSNPIISESTLLSIPFNPALPNLIQGKVNLYELQDQIEYLQVGDQFTYDWYQITY